MWFYERLELGVSWMRKGSCSAGLEVLYVNKGRCGCNGAYDGCL